VSVYFGIRERKLGDMSRMNPAVSGEVHDRGLGRSCRICRFLGWGAGFLWWQSVCRGPDRGVEVGQICGRQLNGRSDVGNLKGGM